MLLPLAIIQPIAELIGGYSGERNNNAIIELSIQKRLNPGLYQDDEDNWIYDFQSLASTTFVADVLPVKASFSVPTVNATYSEVNK